MARSQAQRRVDWFAAGLGLVVAVVIQLVGGTLLFGSHRGQPVSQGLLTFAALLLAGTLAGFIGPAPGAVWNGVIVAGHPGSRHRRRPGRERRHDRRRGRKRRAAPGHRDG